MDRQSNQGIEKGKLSVAQLASAFQRVKVSTPPEIEVAIRTEMVLARSVTLPFDDFEVSPLQAAYRMPREIVECQGPCNAPGPFQFELQPGFLGVWGQDWLFA